MTRGRLGAVVAVISLIFVLTNPASAGTKGVPHASIDSVAHRAANGAAVSVRVRYACRPISTDNFFSVEFLLDQATGPRTTQHAISDTAAVCDGTAHSVSAIFVIPWLETDTASDFYNPSPRGWRTGAAFARVALTDGIDVKVLAAKTVQITNGFVGTPLDPALTLGAAHRVAAGAGVVVKLNLPCTPSESRSLIVVLTQVISPAFGQHSLWSGSQTCTRAKQVFNVTVPAMEGYAWRAAPAFVEATQCDPDNVCHLAWRSVALSQQP
jgi:hypothetical protein